MGVATYVIMLVVGILALQAIVWIGIFAWMRSARATAIASFQSEVAASGERIARGPEPGTYRGGASGLSGASGNGVIALTDRRLWFRKVTGGVVEIPTSSLESVREERWFRSRASGARMHLVVRTKEGAEAAFYVSDNAGWTSALRSAGATGSAPASATGPR